jgi:hypothetical protein
VSECDREASILKSWPTSAVAPWEKILTFCIVTDCYQLQLQSTLIVLIAIKLMSEASLVYCTFSKQGDD